MNKKFLSAILFGALAVTSTGSFVSCKDYDDDIDNLQTQINGLASAKDLSDKVSTLQSAISSAQTAAEAKAAAAQTVADAAKAAADKAGADAADVKKALDAAVADLEAKGATKEELEAAKAVAAEAKAAAEKAGDDAAAAVKAVEEKLEAAVKAADDKAVAAAEAAAAAQKAVEELAAEAASKADLAAVKTAAEAAKAAADKAQAAADEAKAAAAENKAALAEAATKAEVAAVAAKVAANAAALEAKADVEAVEALEARVKALEAAVETLAGGEEAVAALVTIATELEKNLKALGADAKAMITEISLVEAFNYTGQGHQLGYSGQALNLGFKAVSEQTTVFGAGLPGEIKFEAGKAHSLQTSNIVVRVNPANATPAKEDIKLINSKGEALDLIEVTDVKPYETLITRAATENTGLWTISVKMKDDVSMDDLKKATVTKVNNEDKKICYAVAVGNEERSVVSTYDIVAAPDVYVPSSSLDLFVSDKEGVYTSINYIHNRYWETEYPAYQKTEKTELSWYNAVDGKSVIPAIAENIVKETKVADKLYQNVADRISDDRQGWNLLNVEVNKPIDLHVMWDAANEKVANEIKGFYVAYDERNAVESSPSEWNAWTSYEVENLNTVQAGNTGSITIKSEKANGDVIGFRIYAVNLDGTLLDPDGRAFYVYVGDATMIGTVPVQPIKAIKQFGSETTVDFLADFKSALEGVKNDSYWASGWENTKKPEVLDKDGNKLNVPGSIFQVYVDDVEITWENITSTDFAQAKKVKYVMPNALDFVDGGTYEQKMTIYKSNGYGSVVVKTITVSFTKVMPSEAPAVNYITGQNEKLLLAPVANPTTLAEYGFGYMTESAQINLNNVYYELSRAGEGTIIFSVDNSKWNAADDKQAYVDAETGKNAQNPAGTVLSISSVGATADAFKAITDGSEHTIKFAGYYPNVSYTLNADNVALVTGSFTTKETTDYTVTYNCWDKFTTWKWTTDKINNKVFKPELQWTTSGYDGGETIKWSGAAIKAENTKNPEIFNVTFQAYVLGNIVSFPAGDENIYLEDVKNPSQKNNYFTPEIDSDGDITFKYTQNSSAPGEDVKQILKLKVIDVFGHEIVLSLGQVTILKAKAPSK